MPKVSEEDILQPRGYSLWIAGADKSGKTRLALGFPGVFMIKFNPSGDDLLTEPDNAALIPNLKWRIEMNDLPLDSLFAFTEQPGETGIYPAIALAKGLAKKGEIQTFVLDDFTYLAQLKWMQILIAEGVDPSEKEKLVRKNFDSMKCYDALGAYLDNLMLRNIMPLVSPPYNLNLVCTSHLQRESENTIKGSGDTTGSRKRLVNLDSDLAPYTVGSFRQRIGGLMGATIYLEHVAGTKEEPDENGTKRMVEDVKYYAYCKMTRSQTLDTLVKAGNRYGLPAKLNLTGASLYKTLLKKREETRANLVKFKQQQTQPKSEEKTIAPAKATAPKQS